MSSKHISTFSRRRFEEILLEMFARIDQWEHDEIMAASAHSAADAASINRVHAIKRKFADMRNNAMRTVYNAEQFNRRAAWMRKMNCSADDAAAMFPVAQ